MSPTNANLAAEAASLTATEPTDESSSSILAAKLADANLANEQLKDVANGLGQKLDAMQKRVINLQNLLANALRQKRVAEQKRVIDLQNQLANANNDVRVLAVRLNGELDKVDKLEDSNTKIKEEKEELSKMNKNLAKRLKLSVESKSYHQTKPRRTCAKY